MARPHEYPDDLRQQLLDTAARLLATEGPQALATRRIASEVGTSTTAIYSLIGSKHELVRQLFLEGFRRLAEHQQAVERTDDPLSDLLAQCAAYHQSAIDSPELYDVMFGCPVPEFHPSMDDARVALSTLDTCVAAVTRCVDAEIFDGDPVALAEQLWAVIHGVTSLELRGLLGSADDARARLDAALGAAVAGYRVAASEVTPAPAPLRGPRR